MNALTISCATGLAFSAYTLVAYHVALYEDVRFSRRETSRFPLFAARDRLVLLVARAEMREEDLAWQTMYKSVTSLLGLHQRLDALDCMKRYVRFLVDLKKNPRLQSEIEKMASREVAAGRKVPAFGEIREEVAASLDHLVRTRTTPWHTAAIMLLWVGLKLVAVTMSAGVSTARFVRGGLRPSDAPDYFRGWSMRLT